MKKLVCTVLCLISLYSVLFANSRLLTDSTLVQYFTFESVENNIVNDATPAKRNGIMFNVEIKSGQKGQGAEFNNTNSFINGGTIVHIEQPAVNPPFSWPDVNIIQVGDRVYAFGGTDLDPFTIDNREFLMPYWRLFSSSDLIHWEFESMLDPKDLYMGESTKCFAGHGAYRDGKWYWYFSNHNKNTGVAVSDSPKGPWRDALGEPLLPENLTDTHEYDKCVFIDDDGQAYMTFGNHKAQKINYYIVELNDDMISLKDEPKKIEVLGDYSKAQIPVDASFLHKHKGLYYLSWRRPYAVSKNVEGPYTFIGQQDARGHLGFFDFNNQNFVNYTTLRNDMRIRYRFCALAYVHYEDDGSIAPMEELVAKHGVGQYDAGWPKIETEWYMATSAGPLKKRNAEGNFEVQNLQNNDFLNFPNIHNTPANAVVEIRYSSATKNGGKILVKAYKPGGQLLGSANFSGTGAWDKYDTVTIPLDRNPDGTISLSFVVEGESNTELIRMESFRVSKH